MKRVRKLLAFIRGNNEEHVENRVTCPSKDVSSEDRMLTNLGQHELEMPARETTLWHTWRCCKKNPGHFDFIPVHNFGKWHLPSECRDGRFVSYILSASRLVVRISTKLTSPDRPDHYPGANAKGTVQPRFATGFAWITGQTELMPCTIPQCPHNKKRHNVYGFIRIITSRHVVFNEEEATHALCEFFFDTNTPFSSVQCVGIDFCSEETDIVHLRCVTHDHELCAILEDQQESMLVTYKAIPQDFWETCRNLCVVISHPHGLSKSITVGSHVMQESTRSESLAHFHTAPTCPGSSGAPVFYRSMRKKGALPMWTPAVHSYHCLVNNYNCAFR